MTKLAAVGFILFLACYAIWRWFVRHTDVEVVNAPQVMGEVLNLRKITSRRLYFGSGHWGYGGDDSRVVLEFFLEGRTVRWHGKVDEEPRALQIRGKEAFIISQEDRWDATRRAHLNFYAYGSRTGGERWVPVAVQEFPAALAFCNLSRVGRAWREASPEEREKLYQNPDEQYVQEVLDRLFRPRLQGP